MAETAASTTLERDRLVTWALGTFHAATLVVLLVLPLYLTGGLTSLLTSLSTASGLALFIALWLTTVWSTHRALRSVLGTDLQISIPIRKLFARTAWRGGVNGVAFLPLLAVILGISTLINGQGVSVITLVLLGALVFVTVGALTAFLVGCLLGLLFTCLDVALLSLSRPLMHRDTTG